MGKLHNSEAPKRLLALYAEFFDGEPTAKKIAALSLKRAAEFKDRLNHTIITGVVDYAEQFMDIINTFLISDIAEHELPFLLNGMRVAYLASINAEHDAETAEMIKDILDLCKTNLHTVSHLGKPPEVQDDE